ncbi:hypothetical protein CYY_004696 [Polysphondylium violaceum]|uniref:VPS9 domain-containing protein n=1 Tax=Polysphondylium violaceum TaxID=133409 RepID=A0A8J4PXM7_9MYCE|nr:hypothetical protein CYY_004696 [Polysphondylium violaceum]
MWFNSSSSPANSNSNNSNSSSVVSSSNTNNNKGTAVAPIIYNSNNIIGENSNGSSYEQQQQQQQQQQTKKQSSFDNNSILIPKSSSSSILSNLIDDLSLPTSISYESLSNIDSIDQQQQAHNQQQQQQHQHQQQQQSIMIGGENIRIGGGASSAPVSLEESAKEKASFYSKLKSPKAAEIRKSLTNFVVQFSNGAPASIDQQGITIQNYTKELESWILSNPLWANATEPEIEGIRDGIEKYLMTKLFYCTFSPARLGGLEPSEGNIVNELGLVPTEEDLKLYKHIFILGFLEPHHLDIQLSANDARVNQAITELKKINTYKTPRDKIVCIYNCCKVIFKLLKTVSGNPAGADDFLPIFIYVVLRANPLMLQSNIHYIQTFRNPSRLQNETGCYFTHLMSSVSFIENLVNADNLSMSDFEFFQQREKAESELPLRLNPDLLKRLNIKQHPNNIHINNSNNININGGGGGFIQPIARVSTPKSINSYPVNNNQNQKYIPTTPTKGHTRHLSFSNSNHNNNTINNNSITNSISQPMFFGEEDFDHSNSNSPNEHFTFDGIINSELEKRYEFLNYHADDIKIGQIQKLLEDYKRLAIENNLLKSRFNSNSSYQFSEPSSLSSSPALSRVPSSNLVSADTKAFNNTSPILSSSPIHNITNNNNTHNNNNNSHHGLIKNNSNNNLSNLSNQSNLNNNNNNTPSGGDNGLNIDKLSTTSSSTPPLNVDSIINNNNNNQSSDESGLIIPEEDLQ